MKIALVHDWLTGMRGGEKVLAELLKLFPSADLFTLFWKPGSVSREIETRLRGVSFLQRAWKIDSAYRNYLPLYPAAARSLDLRGYDMILSSSHAVAKSVRVPRGCTHFSYIYTPMRYIWESREDYFQFGPGKGWKRLALSAILPWLRHFDRSTAADVHQFIAISQTVAGRIRRVYGAEAAVIPPPVDTDFFSPGERANPDDYYLAVSSLEPYKRIDLVLEAFGGGQRRLVVAGAGTLDGPLRKRAGRGVEFLGWVPDETLLRLYRGCRALIFPAREDFGIVPVEAQACGKPVICFAEGGATETVIDGVTGVYFRQQSPEAIRAAIRSAERFEWDSAAIRAHSLAFSRDAFRRHFRAFWNGRAPAEAHLEIARKSHVCAERN